MTDLAFWQIYHKCIKGTVAVRYPERSNVYRVKVTGIDHFTGGTFHRYRNFKYRIEALLYIAVMSLLYVVEVTHEEN